jgi:hypothetical protein
MFIAIVATVSLLTACSSGIQVPDVSGSDAETAKTVIAALGLVPTLEEKFSDSVEAGIVMGSDPSAGVAQSSGGKVKLLVSAGPKRLTSTNGTANFTNVSPGEDWNYDYPYIEDGTLVIELFEVKFDSEVKWWDPTGNGRGFGEASIKDTFNKTVPIELMWTKQSNKRDQTQDFTLRIPLSGLDVQELSSMFVRLFAEVNGRYQEIWMSFTFAW